ncbi:MAG: putative tetratricopeptide repeat protein [Streblomastix strix]|uniref:Putative tetratricopeptide repeat protein n=1 Tax=Streblomastix strix TaxID=222440 RepID=A0A5J4WQD2_9EUKA|nr:MAG: putative tetratricopeptide repeat protein [Streblomastix strix]
MSHIDDEWKRSPLKNPPFSVVLRDHVGKGGSVESYKTLEIEAHEHLKAGEYEECLRVTELAKKKIIGTLGARSPELIYIKLMQCEAYTALMRLPEALDNVQQAGKLLDLCPGLTESHIFRVYYWRDLGILHRKQLRLDDAALCFQKVASIRKQYQGESHPDTALALVDLALVYKLKGEYDRSLQLLQYALVVHEEYYGSDSIHVGSNLLHQGGVYMRSGRWKEAMEAIKQGKAIMISCGSAEQVDVATADLNLGIIAANSDKFEEAIRFFEKAAQMREQLLGMVHPDTAIVYIHIARALLAQKLYDESEEHVNKALDILETKIATMNNEAKQLDLEKKEQEASEKQENKDGHEDEIKELETQIANAFLTEGASGEAYDIFQEMLDKMNGKKRKKKEDNKDNKDDDEYEEESEDDDMGTGVGKDGLYYEIGQYDPNKAAIICGMANALRQQCKYDKASKMYMRALRLYEMESGIYNSNTATIHMNLGNTYYAWMNMDNAMKHFNLARAVRERIFGTIHPLTCQCLKGIGAVYYALHRFDEALDVYSHAANYLEALNGYNNIDVLEIRRTISEIIRDRAAWKAKEGK